METFEEVLEHFGVKGMKWGVHRSKGPSGRVSEDAKLAIDAKVKVKQTGGTHTLSNKELQDVVTRMNLEQQYARLNPKKSPAVEGQKFVKEALAVFGTASAVHAAVKSPLAKSIKEALNKKK